MDKQDISDNNYHDEVPSRYNKTLTEFFSKATTIIMWVLVIFLMIATILIAIVRKL